MRLPGCCVLVLTILASCSPRVAPTSDLPKNASDARDRDSHDQSRADQQPACPPVAASPEEIAATPRADTNLELLALKLSDSVTARQEIYDRVVGDVAAIRKLRPEVADIPYRSLHDGRMLSFSVDAPTVESMRDGKYPAWDCLNTAYQVIKLEAFIASAIPPSVPYHFVGLTLKGIYNLEEISKEYAGTLTKGTVNPNYPGGDGSTICITRSGVVWHYVLSRGLGDCPAGCTQHVAYYFTTTPGSGPTFHESWDSDVGIPQPSWWLTYGPPNGKMAACPRTPYY